MIPLADHSDQTIAVELAGEASQGVEDYREGRGRTSQALYPFHLENKQVEKTAKNVRHQQKHEDS